jgi:acetylornithine deacetylase
MDHLELLRKLVEIPSPSGYEDGLISFLSAYLEKKGVDHKIEDKNLIIIAPTDFWIVTHLDTIPDKIDFRYDGVYAYGTGVCDAKSSVAAIITALNEIDTLNFGIALLCDEEEGGKGSAKFSKSYKGRAVVMEPTDLKIATEHYGCIEIAATVKGKSSHGSYPEYGINAIERAFYMIEKLRESKLPGKMSLIEIKGGNGLHIIPDQCFLRIDFAIPPQLKAERFLKTIEGILKEYGDFEVVETYDGYREESFKPFEKALQQNGMPIEYAEMHSWTDAINLKNAGWKAIVWGPGELYHCHTPSERVKIEDIVKASRVLLSLNKILG